MEFQFLTKGFFGSKLLYGGVLSNLDKLFTLKDVMMSNTVNIFGNNKSQVGILIIQSKYVDPNPNSPTESPVREDSKKNIQLKEFLESPSSKNSFIESDEEDDSDNDKDIKSINNDKASTNPSVRYSDNVESEYLAEKVDESTAEVEIAIQKTTNKLNNNNIVDDNDDDDYENDEDGVSNNEESDIEEESSSVDENRSHKQVSQTSIKQYPGDNEFVTSKNYLLDSPIVQINAITPFHKSTSGSIIEHEKESSVLDETTMLENYPQHAEVFERKSFTSNDSIDLTSPPPPPPPPHTNKTKSLSTTSLLPMVPPPPPVARSSINESLLTGRRPSITGSGVPPPPPPPPILKSLPLPHHPHVKESAEWNNYVSDDSEIEGAGRSDPIVDDHRDLMYSISHSTSGHIDVGTSDNIEEDKSNQIMPFPSSSDVNNLYESEDNLSYGDDNNNIHYKTELINFSSDVASSRPSVPKRGHVEDKHETYSNTPFVHSEKPDVDHTRDNAISHPIEPDAIESDDYRLEDIHPPVIDDDDRVQESSLEESDGTIAEQLNLRSVNSIPISFPSPTRKSQSIDSLQREFIKVF